METMTFCVPCLFGLEGLVGDELRRLELSNVRVEDRRVFFEGDFAAMAKANLCCRMGERGEHFKKIVEKLKNETY